MWFTNLLGNAVCVWCYGNIVVVYLDLDNTSYIDRYGSYFYNMPLLFDAFYIVSSSLA